MKGLNVNGFVIIEALGSGRSGLLYLARHPTTGQEAILRLAGNAEDGMTAKVFLEEATSLLPSLRAVEPSVTSDGRSVLIARAEAPTEPLPSVQPNAEARTEPLPQPGPGQGRTMYPNTSQLPVAVAQQSRRALPLAMMFIGLAALGAGVTVAMLALRAPPSAPTVALTPPLTADAAAARARPERPSAPPVAPTPSLTADTATARTPPAQPSAPPVALTPPPTADTATTRSPPAAVEQRGVAVPERAPLVAVRPTSVKPSPVAAPQRECVADARWRKAAQSDLNQHRVLAASLGPQPFRRFEVAEDAILEKLEALPMDADCAELDAAIDRLLLSVKPTAAPKVVCTPDELWKRTMQNNLAEVEARANAMESVDVEAEVRVIGAAVERAANQAQCEQAMRRFDALLKRAIK